MLSVLSVMDSTRDFGPFDRGSTPRGRILKIVSHETPLLRDVFSFCQNTGRSIQLGPACMCINNYLFKFSCFALNGNSVTTGFLCEIEVVVDAFEPVVEVGIVRL